MGWMANEDNNETLPVPGDHFYAIMKTSRYCQWPKTERPRIPILWSDAFIIHGPKLSAVNLLPSSLLEGFFPRGEDLPSQDQTWNLLGPIRKSFFITYSGAVFMFLPWSSGENHPNNLRIKWSHWAGLLEPNNNRRAVPGQLEMRRCGCKEVFAPWKTYVMSPLCYWTFFLLCMSVGMNTRWHYVYTV